MLKKFINIIAILIISFTTYSCVDDAIKLIEM